MLHLPYLPRVPGLERSNYQGWLSNIYATPPQRQHHSMSTIIGTKLMLNSADMILDSLLANV
jgi:hypothetical protein